MAGFGQVPLPCAGSCSSTLPTDPRSGTTRRGPPARPAHPRSTPPAPAFSTEETLVKFRVERDVFADAVAWAARSLPVRPSAPVLAGLLIEASDAGLVLSTFDYETSARATLSAEVNDEGKALVSGRLLADICRSLPAKPVELTLEGPRVSLTCGSARFSLQTMPVADYPTLPEMPVGHRHRLERRLRPRRRPGRHRGRSRRHAAGAHRRTDRDRRLDHGAAGHRPLPALAPRAHLEPAVPRRVGRRTGAGQGARRHRQVAHLRRRGDHRAEPRRRPARA